MAQRDEAYAKRLHVQSALGREEIVGSWKQHIEENISLVSSLREEDHSSVESQNRFEPVVTERNEANAKLLQSKLLGMGAANGSREQPKEHKLHASFSEEEKNSCMEIRNQMESVRRQRNEGLSERQRTLSEKEAGTLHLITEVQLKALLSSALAGAESEIRALRHQNNDLIKENQSSSSQLNRFRVERNAVIQKKEQLLQNSRKTEMEKEELKQRLSALETEAGLWDLSGTRTNWETKLKFSFGQRLN
ncbi:ELKS/Rab6-interacting/CAST family member 1 [Gracilaria domingensis]|nr:ELKS/Rab6-interacting/CAST family member 1 [Gracilaria domingensis]